MKKTYLKPQIEVFLYQPEKGYAVSVALEQHTHDYVLIEGSDRSTMRSAEEITEYQYEDQYTTGEWE